jgi:phospholipid/cholesterol/gamma-HCH transport system substrate-binding protein
MPASMAFVYDIPRRPLTARRNPYSEVYMFDLRKEIRWAQVKVGIIITAALAVLFLSVFFSGSIGTLLTPKVTIKADMTDVKGLKNGAPVWLFGIEEGSVTKISLDRRYGTVVTLSINKNALRFLRKDSTASIQTLGLLGDKYVDLTSGSQTAPPLDPGDMIRGTAQVELTDIMKTSAGSVQKLTDFVDKMGRLVEKIDKSKGTFSKFLEDPALYNNLKDTSKELSLLARDIRAGHGTIGLLLKDPTLYERLASASGSLEGFSRKLESGTGTLNKLMEDDLLYQKLVGAASSMDEFGRKLNDPSGTMGKLLGNPQLYDNLDSASRKLSLILERIDRGEGAAGKLISDKEMAKDLQEVVTELKKLTTDVREHPHRYFKFSIF